MEELGRKVTDLESENTALRERLRALEVGRAPLSQLPTPPRTQGAVSAEDTQPAAEQDPGQLMHYLKTVLGFTIRYRDSVVILRSVYSFCEEDVFEIEVKNSKLVLRHTEYLDEWGEYLNTYVKMGRSYSAFFAAVTLDLFNKKTFG